MVPTNIDRGLSAAAGTGVGCNDGCARGTKERGTPTEPSPDDGNRRVTYRIEDTVPHTPQDIESNSRAFYPYWLTKPFPPGYAAPERLDLSGGIVAYRVGPDWQGPQEAPLTPPPLVQAPQEPPLTPPPLVQAPRPRPKPPPAAPPPPPPPPPRVPRACPPGYEPTKSGKACVPTDAWQAARDAIGHAQERRQAIRAYTDATLDDGFKNAAQVAKWASHIPGPAGGVFKGLEAFFETTHDLYVGAKFVEQLIGEMSQSDAMAEGTKELAKKGEEAFTKAAEKKLDKLLKQKGIVLPEPAKKEIIKRARDFFDKKIRDPAIEKGKKEFEKRMDPKERDKSLLDDWKEKWDRATGNNGLPLFR
jgi:hypothetical protein